MLGRHAQDLWAGRDDVLHPGYAMQAQHQANLLQHITIIVDPGLVEAHRNRHALGLEDIKRRHATSQAKIGTAVMADAGAGVGSKLNIFLCKPDAMAKRQRGPQKSKAMQVL